MHRPRRTGIFPVLFAFLALAAGPSRVSAQYAVRSWLPWRTIETQRFVFHYPVELEAWTQELASHADAVADAAAAVVGYRPPTKTQVVVDDPYEIANGMAWPFIGEPVINLWATPPDPREDIGEFRGWGETLLSHEYTHVAHLIRPSRNTRWQRLWGLLPVQLGPIPVNAPAWVIEGYATLVEGRVTGSGRPHGSWRPAFLREWAIEGQLPRYDQLSAAGGYEGGEFRYLAGSAFLEWLAARGGDSSLVHLWRRMTARESRSFDAAFIGVFGESPRALYGRFSAELTAHSIGLAQGMRRAFPGDTGAIVQRLSWATGDPSISADGRRVAITLRSPISSRIVIWGTAPEPDTGRVKRDSALLARDPQDVPARPIYPPPKKALATLRARSGSSFDEPRFLRDGRVLVQRFVPLSDGTPRTDLYVWNPQGGKVRRVTRGAAVRLADPFPDGQSVAAVRCARGWCDLVRVDLASGAVSTIREGSPRRSYYRPRISPGGDRIAVAMHDGMYWRVEIVNASTGIPTDTISVNNVYDAAWMNDSTLVATTDAEGDAQIATIDLRSHTVRLITHVTGAAVAPEPERAHGAVWFLSLYSQGYDLRRVERADQGTTNSQNPVARSAATMNPPVPVPDFATNAVTSPRPYDSRPRATRYAPLPFADASGTSAGLIIANEDVVGQHQVLLRALGGFDGGWRGAALDLTGRRKRPFGRFELFDAGQRGFTTFGGMVAIDQTFAEETWSGRWRAGAGVGRLRTDSSRTRRQMLFTDVSAGWSQRDGARSTSQSLAASVTTGSTEATRYSRGVATLGLSESGFLVFPLSASATYARVSSGAPAFERISLGGGASPLLDRALLSQRVPMPALPTSVAEGLSAFSYQITLINRPLNVYYWAGSASASGDRFDTWHRVIGLESSEFTPAIRSAAAPNVRATFGVGESLDAPLRRKVRGYFTVIVTP